MTAGTHDVPRPAAPSTLELFTPKLLTVFREGYGAGQLRRDAIARLGINAEDVLDVIETIGGKRVGTVVEGEKRFHLQVRFNQDVRATLDRIRDLRVSGPEHDAGPRALVPLSQLAELKLETGPAQISRERISRRITVEANVRGRDLAGYVAEAQRRCVAVAPNAAAKHRRRRTPRRRDNKTK